ncbi:MAG: hypothetical protein ABR525_11640, partial [Candidatus Limnocylindria bacterium]
MAGDRRKVAAFRPTPIAVHDDRDVPWDGVIRGHWLYRQDLLLFGVTDLVGCRDVEIGELLELL